MNPVCIQVTTSRTHWRGGQEFVQGKLKELVVPDQVSEEQFTLIKEDPELLVKVLGELSSEPLARPEDEDTRILTIQEAMFSLPGGKDAFTKAGTPRISVLEDVLGWKPESDDVDAAVDGLSEEMKADLKALLEA
ncbi:hypothetical protein ACQU0X_06650 [Pseudovibrio ascidiaceicola]|uniref:hypothetical protein n=1 Tax=Pseudovibrio ascidiaceicola TaxID=285279 RepID=UPI003D35BC92